MLQVRCGHIKAEPNNLAKNDAKFVKNMQPQKKNVEKMTCFVIHCCRPNVVPTVARNK